MNIGVENENQEFKESTSQLSKALESLAAMLNKNGKGMVYFGINDKGEIIGQEIGNKTQKDISEAVTERIKPQVIPKIEFINFENRIVIAVSVEGNNKPYSADGKYLIRSGSENKKIEPELLKELVFTNTSELITEAESLNQDLTFDQIKQLLISKGLSVNDKTFAKNNNMLCQNGKYNILADLLSDNNNISIKVVRFAGKDKSEMIYRNEYGYKCLILAMKQALEYVNTLNEAKVKLENELERKEIHLFDGKSLREAWTNACLHSKWIKRIPPAIYIYSNRIEVISTGGLPLDYSIEEFYNGISHPINKQLQKIMGQLGIVEQTGHGVLEIIKNYGKDAFTITDNNIIVTLKFPYELDYVDSKYNDLLPSQKRVLLAIKNDPMIKTNEITKVVGLGISRVNVIIKELKKLKYIERVGSNKSGYWKVNN